MGKPSIGKWQMRKHQHRENMTYNICGQGVKDKYLTTWAIPDGDVRRGIDYITINQKYRNTVRTTQTAQKWRGNMEQQRQHAVIKMQLRIRFGEHYFYIPPPETGTGIQYHIKHAKKKPELLDQHFQAQQIHRKYDANKITTDNWKKAKAMLHGALLSVYPIIAQDNKIQIWERQGYEHATIEEQEIYDKLLEERSTIQHRINEHDKQLTK